MKFMPEVISSFGGDIDSLAILVTILGGFFLIIGELYLIYSALKYRKSKGSKAEYIPGKGWKQLKYIFIPVILFCFVDLVVDVQTHSLWDAIKISRPKADVEIGITGQQFSWLFDHPGPDGKLGTEDDVRKLNELHIPVDSKIVFNLGSKDVLHSFFVPTMRFKQDAVPGRIIKGWFDATKTGEYDIACAEICGAGHRSMKATLYVHSKEEYAQWVANGGTLGGEVADPVAEGKRLIQAKGCVACHTVDGTPLVGPTYKGLFGSKEVIVKDGAEKEILVDEAYIKNSILEPQADIVKGFPPVMPSQKGLVSDKEIEYIIEYFKTLK